MKKFLNCVAWGVLSAQAFSINASAVTNVVEFIRPNDTGTPHPLYTPSKIGQVATNTPAFDEYGFRLMLKEAESMREKWGLDIPELLSASNVLFDLKATSAGIDGNMATKNGRFRWRFFRNELLKFTDTNYDSQSFCYHDDESARLGKIKSKITAKEAEAIARERLNQLGLTVKQLHLIEPPQVIQYKFEESDGTVYPLPVFNVGWAEKGSEDMAGMVYFNISGITKQVVDYFNAVPRSSHITIPTNYYEMLGVKPPTNFSQRVGFKPLDPLLPATNSAVK